MALIRWANERWHNFPGWTPKNKWKIKSRSGESVFLKRCMNRSERQRCRLNIECDPGYKMKKGYLL